MKGQIWTVGLVGILASMVGGVFVVALMHPTPTYAKTGSSSEDIVVVTGNIKGGNLDVLYIIDTRSKRLLVFEVRGRSLVLGAARNIEWDLQLDEWPRGSHTPSVKKVRKDTEKKADPPSGGKQKILAATGNFLSDQHDLLYLMDTRSRRLVIYEYNNRRLDILAARNIRFDFKLDEWPQGKQKPSVKQVHDWIKNPDGN